MYVGQERTNCANCFGSAHSRLIESDFTREQLRDFSIRKEILWESATASREELNRREVELILDLRANHPDFGYNRSPRLVAPTAR